MPTYSYECECGQQTDTFHSIYDEPKIECEKCGGPMRRVFSAPAITFNGSGFYTTDKKK